MVKPKTFVSDIQWQKVNYKQLVELSQHAEYAKIIVDYLDQNPDIRSDLSGIYFRAKETIKSKV